MTDIIQPAHIQPVRLVMTRARIRAYADISNDYNPIHVDPDFAARSPMGGIIAHGTLSLNLIWQALEQTFGTPGAQAHVSEVKFRAPVREDDAIEAGGARLPDGTYAIWAKNQRGETVIEGVARIA